MEGVPPCTPKKRNIFWNTDDTPPGAACEFRYVRRKHIPLSPKGTTGFFQQKWTGGVRKTLNPSTSLRGMVLETMSTWVYD